MTLQGFLLMASALFAVGLYGALSQQSIVMVMMGLELMINAIMAAGAALFVFLFPAGLRGADDDAAKAEVKKFEGAWSSHAVVVNGNQQSIRPDLHIFSGNKWTQKFKGRVVAEGTQKVQPGTAVEVVGRIEVSS